MKALVWTLLLIICTHVLVLDAMHHEHDADVAVEQLDDAPVQLDVLDAGGDHCCQCHGFMASMECAPARLPAPPATVLALRPPCRMRRRIIRFALQSPDRLSEPELRLSATDSG